MPAVRSFVPTALALVPASASASDLAKKLPSLLSRAVPDVARLSEAGADWGMPLAPDELEPARLAYLTTAAPDTLILTESST